MAEPQRRFQVIEGGTAAKSADPLIDTGIAGGGGEPPVLKRPKAGGGGRGGGSQAVSIAKLEQSVGWAWKAIGSIFTLGLIGMVSLYFLLAGRIDDQYDKIGTKIDHVGDKISDLRVVVASQARTPNDQPQAGATAGQAGAVHQGTGSGKRPKG